MPRSEAGAAFPLDELEYSLRRPRTVFSAAFTALITLLTLVAATSAPMTDITALGISSLHLRVRDNCHRGLRHRSVRRRQPPRPDKIKIKGNIEQQLIELACSDPPEGRCHWTLQLLADELVVLGLVDRIGIETVRQALKKTTSSRGSSRPGASRRAPTAEYVWRMEDVIQTYLLPYDPAYPVVCFDEACKQLFGEVREPRATRDAQRWCRCSPWSTCSSSEESTS